MRTTSANLKKAAFASQTDEAVLLLLDIDHADLAAPIRVSSDAINTPHGEDFAATFARASTAYKQDGSQVAADQPRYEENGVMLEEGTTTVPANPFFAAGVGDWSPYVNAADGADMAVAAVAGGAFGGQVAQLSVISPGDTGGDLQFYKSIGSVADGQKIAVAIRLKATQEIQANLQVLEHDSPYTLFGQLALDITTEFRRFEFCVTASKATEARIDLSFGLAAAGVVIEVDYFYAELGKEYSTSPHDGTRAGESVDVDIASILSAAEGTIDIDIDVTASMLAARTRLWEVLRGDGVNEGILVEQANGQWHLRVRDDGNNPTPVSVSSAGTPLGRRRFSAVWSAGSLRFFLDGALLGSADNPSLPSALDGTLHLGRNAAGARFWINTTIGAVRLSSRARTDAEILAEAGGPLRIDEDTTGYFSFDQTLASHHCYLAFPFEITLPDDRDDQVSRARLRIDNVDRRIVEAVRSISGRPTVELRVVLGSTPARLEVGPLRFELLDCSWDALTVEGELGYETEILDQRYPAHAMTPQYFPGLFA